VNIQEEACSYILTTDTKAVIVASVCTLTVGLECAACHDNICATGTNNTTGLTFVATIFYCEHQSTGVIFVTAIFVCIFKYTTRQLAQSGKNYEVSSSKLGRKTNWNHSWFPSVFPSKFWHRRKSDKVHLFPHSFNSIRTAILSPDTVYSDLRSTSL